MHMLRTSARPATSPQQGAQAPAEPLDRGDAFVERLGDEVFVLLADALAIELFGVDEQSVVVGEVLLEPRRQAFERADPRGAAAAESAGSAGSVR